MKDMLYSWVSEGIFWSYAYVGAVAHSDSEDYNTIILKAAINPEDVEWDTTLYKSLYYLSEEKEDQLLKNCSIEIVSIEISSNHPLYNFLYKNDVDYFTSIGIKDPYKVANSRIKDKAYINFDESIIVNTRI